MGNGGSVSGFGFSFMWKSANPEDREKIEVFVIGAGFEKTKEIVDSEPALKQVLDDQGCPFPEYEAELDLWFEEMEPN